MSTMSDSARVVRVRRERRRAGGWRLRERRRALVGGLSILLPAVAVAIACAYGITALRGEADDSRRAETLVARVEAQTNLQTVHAWQAIGEREVAAERIQQISSIRDEIRVRLDELTWLAGDEAALDQLDTALTAYQDALDAELGALTGGLGPEAREAARQTVDEAFAKLTVLLAGLGTTYSTNAERTNGLSQLGTVSSLVSAAILLSLMFRKFERVRRTSALIAAEEKGLRESEERFRSLVQNASDTITVVDATGVIHYQSPSVERLLGYPAGSVAGTSIAALIHPADRASVLEALGRAVASPSPVKVEVRLLHEDGSWIHAETIVTDLSDDPHVGGIVLNTRDVSERKVLEEQLTYRAYHDALTELPNRALFRDRLSNALARAARTDSTVAVLFLDLDDFKTVNDTLGHETGDILLRVVAERLSGGLRAADTVARLAGDEFAVLAEGASAAEPVRIAERLHEALGRPFPIQDRLLTVGASIGIAVSRAGAGTVDDLLRDADVAMYVAKSQGKGRYAMFEPSMQEAVVMRVELEAQLRTALDDDQFLLHFQPLVELRTGRILALEALLRWDHPVRGLLTPDSFLSEAEEAGLMPQIGRVVLETACAQLGEWRRSRTMRRIPMSVNLSPQQVLAADLPAEIVRHLAAVGLAPHELILEITERAVVSDSESTIRRLEELRALGFRLAIDDFGTGYSSLAYLQRFPLDMLKVDRSFVADLDGGASQGTVVRALVTLGRDLGLRVVAEGIERPGQVERLVALGCELGQGYLLAPPLPAAEAERLVRAGSLTRPELPAAAVALQPSRALGS